MARSYKFVGILVSAVLISACGGPLKYDVASSPKAPGADAHIVAKVKEAERLTLLEVNVENLAPPDRVAPGSTQFLAWYRKDSGAVWSRIAALDYKADSRKGSVTASAPEVLFDFQITAEIDGTPASPSPNVVFSQRIGENK